jgi:hypothetical protein
MEATQEPRRRGNIKPKVELVRNAYARLTHWRITEPGWSDDPDLEAVIKHLEKFLKRHRKEA